MGRANAKHAVALAKNHQRVAGLDVHFFTCLGRNNYLAFGADSRSAIKVWAVVSEFVHVGMKCITYHTYHTYLQPAMSSTTPIFLGSHNRYTGVHETQRTL